MSRTLAPPSRRSLFGFVNAKPSIIRSLVHQDSLQNELRAVRDDLQSVDQQLQATIEVCMGLVFGPQDMPPDAEGSPES